MDYDDDNDNQGLSKGPFYGAAAFIFVVLALFVSVVLQENGSLGHWQIATCIMGSGLVAVLLFLPHFLEGILEKLEESISRQDSDTSSKAFFELKEIRSELDALSLKIDKVPTLVNKIVSDSQLDNAEPTSNGIIDQISQLETELRSRLDRIEESSTPPSPITDLDPSIISLEKEIKSIGTQIDTIHEKLNRPNDPGPETKPEIEITASSPTHSVESTKETEKSTPSAQSENEPDSLSEENPVEPESVAEELTQDTQENEQRDDLKEEIVSAEGSPEEDDHSSSEKLMEDNEPDTVPVEEVKVEESALGTEEINPMTKDQEPEQVSDELNLGLPAPEETLRKVDALLAGEELSPKTDKIESSKEQIDKNETTTVVANVMIGIGNKPYLRGEGPGLSWSEGVSMNFIEIGKWAWSPPRKNASLTVQIYRNDQDPDKGGKVEVKPGQKLEITPDFS